MSACAQCGETLIGAGKFCAFCGAAVEGTTSTTGRVSIPSAPPAVSTAPSTSPPPRGTSHTPPPPMAGRPTGYSQLPPSQVPVTVQPTTNASPPYAPFPTPYLVGTHVLVQWADGNRYPGIVQQIAPGQCLIVFPDGQQRWVDNQFLASGR